MEDWAEIRRLSRSEGMSIKGIARAMGISKNTVRRALRASDPPRYERAAMGSAVDVFVPRIRECLTLDARMPATVIAERVGWDRSMSVFRARVAQIRPEFVPVDPASRTVYEPGEIMQCDLWFPPVKIPLGHGHADSPPVLVMSCGYSRFLMARMIPSRCTEDLVLGHWSLLSEFGACAKTLVWDNEGGIGRRVSGRVRLTAGFEALRGALGVKVYLARPADPETKGIVERNNGYLETSFMPGRTFTSPTDFNAQLGQWLTKANNRHHRRLECRPVDRVGADRAAMVPLPPVAPTLGWRTSVRLPRDHYVRLDSVDYSVDPAVIGRMVHVHADLEQVTVRHDGAVVARHDRCWAPHQSITAAEHAERAAALRQMRPRPAAEAATDNVEVRDLAGYDRIFGIHDAA